MGRPKTPALPTDVIGQLFRDRVLELLPLAFPKEENDTDRIEALARRSGVGKETIRAALKGQRSPRLVAVDAIARALGLSIAQLFATVPQKTNGQQVLAKAEIPFSETPKEPSPTRRAKP